MGKHLQVAIAAAKEAGLFILENFGKVSYLDAEEKRDNDWVTFVDRKSEEIIRSILSSEFPHYQFLGEEEGMQGLSSDYVWVVDPLDGTKNFLHGIDIFAISCALLHNGEPEVGVVLNPSRNELFYAGRGEGAFRNGDLLMINTSGDVEKSLFGTAFPFRDKTKFEFLESIFGKVFMKFSDMRRLGSAALDLCYVADGTFAVFYEYGLSAWDIAAGALIVEEAGGTVKDFNGAKAYLNTGDIVAGSREAVQIVLNAIKESYGS